MLNKSGFAQRLLLLVTPIVSGSMLSAAPSLAATSASSQTAFDIYNFNQNPTKIQTLTNTNAQVFALSGKVNGDANAVADFVVNSFPALTSAHNISFSTVNGEGSDYLGLAQSIAGVIGYDFQVGANEDFSFNFNGLLNLNTSIDNPAVESASAYGNIAFQLYDATNGSLLDYFTVSGRLTTPGNGDSLNYNKSASIAFNPKTSFETSFRGNQESATASINGTYSRTFQNSTHLDLVEFKTNQATVSVPEPSTTLASLCFCLMGVGYRVRTKLTQSLKLKSK